MTVLVSTLVHIGAEAWRLPRSQANVIRLDQLTARTILSPINPSYVFAKILSPARYILYMRVYVSDMWPSSSTKKYKLNNFPSLLFHSSRNHVTEV